MLVKSGVPFGSDGIFQEIKHSAIHPFLDLDVIAPDTFRTYGNETRPSGSIIGRTRLTTQSVYRKVGFALLDL